MAIDNQTRKNDELESTDRIPESNKEDLGGDAAATNPDNGKLKSKSKKDTSPPPTVLFDYLAELYKGQNFNKAYKNAFNKIDLESRLTIGQLDELLELSRLGDRENKLLISLAEFLLEGHGSK